MTFEWLKKLFCKHRLANITYNEYSATCKCGHIIYRDSMDYIGQDWFDYFYKREKRKKKT